ncbi:MAG: HipA family kinase [Candidatus Acidiferrales bacterium]
MALAVEQVRRMRGGAQAHLMRCDDEGHYVVKFQNNPQGKRILANELLGTRLAARLGLAAPQAAVVEVREELIAHTEDLVMQLGRGRAPCQPGLQFGSRYPGAPAEVGVFDFLPEEQLRSVVNLSDFCGIFVFDKWTCNTNGRQAIFFRTGGETRYQAQMVDQGFCFNAGEWNFPDAPLRGLYARHRVYDSVCGIESFEPWLARVEEKMTESLVEGIYSEIPPEWYDFEPDALEKMLEQLLRRRKLVRDLIVGAWKSTAQPFPNWK